MTRGRGQHRRVALLAELNDGLLAAIDGDPHIGEELLVMCFKIFEHAILDFGVAPLEQRNAEAVGRFEHRVVARLAEGRGDAHEPQKV